MSKNITDPNYSLMSLEDFFGIKDPVRLVIIIYIFISLILNIFIFVIVSIIHFKKKVFSLGILVTCAILFVNFAHTFAYFFQWVIKDNTTKYIINTLNYSSTARTFFISHFTHYITIFANFQSTSTFKMSY